MGWEHVNLSGDYVWGEGEVAFVPEGGGPGPTTPAASPVDDGVARRSLVIGATWCEKIHAF